MQVTNFNGCKNVSDSFNLVAAAIPISTPTNYIAKLIPNPAATQVIVQFAQLPLSTITLQLLNAKGRIIKQINTQNKVTSITLGDVLSGNYFFRVIGKEYNQTQQLIINK
jgi:hypothetical protein